MCRDCHRNRVSLLTARCLSGSALLCIRTLQRKVPPRHALSSTTSQVTSCPIDLLRIGSLVSGATLLCNRTSLAMKSDPEPVECHLRYHHGTMVLMTCIITWVISFNSAFVAQAADRRAKVDFSNYDTPLYEQILCDRNILEIRRL